MNPFSMSRCHWIGAGLATCSYLAAARCRAVADETSLLGYTRPGAVTLRGLAPRLQHRVISTGPHGEKTYAVIFGKGDEVLSGLTELAEHEDIQAAQTSAIGAFQHAVYESDERGRFYFYELWENTGVLEQHAASLTPSDRQSALLASNLPKPLPNV